MNERCKDCAKCCFNTEMMLNIEDIERIERLNSDGLTKTDFCEQKGGFFFLRNQENHCIFLNLETLTCSIYEIRPAGCRFYPLIFDQYEDRCIFDDYCPRKHLFYMNHKKFKEVCVSLRTFINNLLNDKTI